uniref:Mce associated membrane protein n=1 Tax=Mycolicibacterium gilvum (strain PYR-GCK) TaxID=350054 RepID=A4T3A8_MYCGI|nr:conserved hypothetical protein [Mycolicibacterium gilvum PYR-GCK]
MTVTTQSTRDDEPDTSADDEQTPEGAGPGDADVADAHTETEPADDDSDPDEPMTARGWRRRVLLGVVALVFAALLAVSGVLGWMTWKQHQLTQAGEQARQAAVTYAQVLTSIDSAKVDENFNQVLDGATGEFKDMYSESSMQLRQLLIDNKAASRGVVVESAIQSVEEGRVVVLLFVDQSVTNSAVPDPRIDRSRIKMTMEYVDGRWRAAKVELA